MKLTKIPNLMVLGLALTIAASGCKSHKTDVTQLPYGSRPATTPLDTGGPVRETRLVPNTPQTGNPGGPAQRPPYNPPPIDKGAPLPGTGDVSSTPLVPPPVMPTPMPPTNDVPVESLNKQHPPNEFGHPDWVPDRETLRAQTVYFEFDKSTVKSGEEAKINAVAEYLRNNPTTALLIEGNCDERGTEEYNRSLGERRALATREILIRLGIDPGRIDTVTYGEDRPAELGHTEAAWSKNRRDEFVVLTPPKA